MDRAATNLMRVIAGERRALAAGRGNGAILVDRDRLPQAEADMLDPAWWQARATPVSGQGGRGAAWFVADGFGQGVLRRYRRGGFAARLSTDRYLWTGESRCRSFREFRLLALLRLQGLPVPAPLMAGYRRHGLSYSAAILVERIPDVRSLAELACSTPDGAHWEAVGAMLARFHAAGVEHADLNATNVLLDGADAPWLIDFDRGRLRPPAAGWREANLARLQRSLAKLCGDAADAAWRSGFARLRRVYQARLEARTGEGGA